MHVLIDYRPALRNRSGTGEYTHQLAAALRQAFPSAHGDRGLDLTIFSSSWRDRLALDDELRGLATVDRRVPVRLLNLAWHRLGWPTAETLSGRTFDVTHSSHPLLMPSRHAAQIVTIHDLDFLAHPDRTRAEIRRDYPVLVRDHAQRAARVLVPSQFTARAVERDLGVHPERVVICPPGAPDWTPRQESAANGYILFFSTLEPRKNVGGLLDAYEQLLARAHAERRDPPDLVLAGKATDDARVWLDRLARAPLAGHARHAGYIHPSQRRAMYEGARLLVMPSFDEGFGMPALEAMACGVPVIVSNRGSLPEVVGDAGPLVDPENPAEIAAAMAHMLENTTYAADCAAKGLARARHFNWASTAQLVYDAYRGAVADRRRLSNKH